MVKWKKGGVTEEGWFRVILFIILFAIAIMIIFWMRSGSENTDVVLAVIDNKISNIFA